MTEEHPITFAAFNGNTAEHLRRPGGRPDLRLKFKQLFGAYVDSVNQLRYTDDSRGWFDLSLISAYGRGQADKLKFQNRRTYQELIFEGLGFRFNGEPYLLPTPIESITMRNILALIIS